MTDKEAIETLAQPESECNPQDLCAGCRCKYAHVQPEQEPVAFEEWLAKQHGDPEEIGFLQALRIAYLAGQDSITHPPQRNPLTDERRQELMSKAWNKWLSRKDDGRLFAWDFSFEVEAAHGIKEDT